MADNLTRHADVILGAILGCDPHNVLASYCAGADEPGLREAILTACAGLFDAGAAAMKEKAYRACLDCTSTALNNRGAAAIAISAIDPACLREGL